MAEDIWERQLHEASFGGVRIDVLSTRDTAGRALAIYKYPHVDGADTEDMGGEPRITSAQLIFFPVSPQDDPYDRFLTFKTFVDSGEVLEFIHPLTGAYDARVEEFEFEAKAEERDTIRVTCTFIEHSTAQAIFDAGPGAPAPAGLEQVSGTADELSAAIAAAGLAASTTPDECVTAVERWVSDATVTAREIDLELVKLSNKVAAMNEQYALATDPSRWTILRHVTMLNYQLRRAAESVTATTPRIIEITIQQAIPLLVLCARTYGAAEAMFRYEQVMKLNDIRNPARLEPGTVLRAQSPRAPRRRLRLP